MIRGTIESVATDGVVGWVHSEVAAVRDMTVLAFVGERCVGGGRVNVYRPDLEEAGLGDGHVGFRFGIALPEPGALDQLVIRFEGSDMSLLQRNQSVGKEAEAPASDKAGYSRTSINWLRDQGWIGQIEFDFLNQITTLGVFDRSLRVTREDALSPAAEVKRLFELYCQAPVVIEKEEVPLEALGSAGLRRDPELLAIAAVHATDGALAILEGSHVEGSGDAVAGDAGSVRHHLRADRLLLVNTRAAFTCEGNGTALLFRARLLNAAQRETRRAA